MFGWSFRSLSFLLVVGDVVSMVPEDACIYSLVNLPYLDFSILQPTYSSANLFMSCANTNIVTLYNCLTNCAHDRGMYLCYCFLSPIHSLSALILSKVVYCAAMCFDFYCERKNS